MIQTRVPLDSESFGVLVNNQELRGETVSPGDQVQCVVAPWLRRNSTFAIEILLERKALEAVSVIVWLHRLSQPPVRPSSM